MAIYGDRVRMIEKVLFRCPSQNTMGEGRTTPRDINLRRPLEGKNIEKVERYHSWNSPQLIAVRLTALAAMLMLCVSGSLRQGTIPPICLSEPRGSLHPFIRLRRGDIDASDQIPSSFHSFEVA